MKCDHPATQVVTETSTRGYPTATVECSRCYEEIASVTSRHRNDAVSKAKKRASRKFTSGAGWHDVPPEPGDYLVRGPNRPDEVVRISGDPSPDPTARYYGPIPEDE